jgi:hypothetical protein
MISNLSSGLDWFVRQIHTRGKRVDLAKARAIAVRLPEGPSMALIQILGAEDEERLAIDEP